MKRCADLKFGFIDAQRYIQNPDDPLAEFFRKSFYKSHHLERAVDPDLYFLLGEKGTGKTAYAVYASLYMQDEYRADCEFFDKNDFTRFIEVASALCLSKSQYSAAWVCIFLLLFMQKLEINSLIDKNSSVSPFIRAVQEVNLGGYAKTISQCIETVSEINVFFDKICNEFDVGISRNLVASAKPYFKISRFIDLCVDALSKLPPQTQFSLFIDGLDVRPDDVSYPDYVNVVSSICNSIWVLNATQLARIQPSFKATILLRPDIFEAIPFQNRGPKLQNHAHLVEWSARYKQFEESEIFKFTDSVLRSQQEPNSRLFPGDAWKHYFNFTVDSRVRKDTGDDPFILFLRHSFYKPRDIIKYLTLMAEFYKAPDRESLDQFSKDVFDDPTIRKEFSSYLLQEIRDQLAFYYTNEEYQQQFLDFSQGFLGRHIDRHTRVVLYSDFEKAHKEYLEYNQKNNITTHASFATADMTLQFMFDLNVVGFYEEKVVKGKKRVFTNYSFRQRSFANLRPKIPTGGRYVMHYGIAKSLFVEFGT